MTLKYAKKAFAAGAPPRTPLGELAKKNFKTFKQLETQIHGRSRTNLVFQNFQDLEFEK